MPIFIFLIAESVFDVIGFDSTLWHIEIWHQFSFGYRPNINKAHLDLKRGEEQKREVKSWQTIHGIMHATFAGNVIASTTGTTTKKVNHASAMNVLPSIRQSTRYVHDHVSQISVLSKREIDGWANVLG